MNKPFSTVDESPMNEDFVTITYLLANAVGGGGGSGGGRDDKPGGGSGSGGGRDDRPRDCNWVLAALGGTAGFLLGGPPGALIGGGVGCLGTGR
jgi:hypothetical protein